jgi:hypothetical protein
VLLAALIFPAPSNAFSAWLAARGDTFSGSGELFTEFENDYGFGIEAGLSLGLLTTAVEFLVMGDSQYLFDANVGVDFSFGDDIRLSVGAFTGPLLFFFPEAEPPSGVDLSSALTPNEQTALLAAGGFASVSEAEAEFNALSETENDLGSLAFGWNLLRGRVAIDYGLFGPVHLGVAGQVGYHLLISGEDVAAGAKNAIIDQYVAENNVPSELIDPLRAAIGARPVDTDSLNGINYNVNLFLRIEVP